MCIHKQTRCEVVGGSISSFVTSPRCPTFTYAHTGWKAPVPQASRWVRLKGCSKRTKFAHSVCPKNTKIEVILKCWWFW